MGKVRGTSGEHRGGMPLVDCRIRALLDARRNSPDPYPIRQALLDLARCCDEAAAELPVPYEGRGQAA